MKNAVSGRLNSRGAAMIDAGLDFAIPLFAGAQSNAQVAVMAALSEEEFARAQVLISDLSGRGDYADWLDYREGFLIGLSMAGVEIETVSVALPPFLAWCRLAQTRPSERALDAFALMLFLWRKPPGPIALAPARESEFQSDTQTIDTFASQGDFQRWSGHRAGLQASMAQAYGRIEPLPVNIDDFVQWTRCLGESASEVPLDAYATLVLEFLRQDPKA
jgi:hypothetical protein